MSSGTLSGSLDDYDERVLWRGSKVIERAEGKREVFLIEVCSEEQILSTNKKRLQRGCTVFLPLWRETLKMVYFPVQNRAIRPEKDG